MPVGDIPLHVFLLKVRGGPFEAFWQSVVERTILGRGVLTVPGPDAFLVAMIVLSLSSWWLKGFSVLLSFKMTKSVY